MVLSRRPDLVICAHNHEAPFEKHLAPAIRLPRTNIGLRKHRCHAPAPAETQIIKHSTRRDFRAETRRR